MDSQLQQLRDAVKAVAKARAEGKPIDLSALPPEIRQKLEAQLAKLPAEARARAQGAAGHAGQKVDAVINRATGGVVPATRGGVIPHYTGHYNNTVRPGDATRFPVTWIAAVLVIGWVLWRLTQ
jgi:hypothetical protein